MKKLADAILLAAKLREDSFDHEEAQRLGNGKQAFASDFLKCYKLTMDQAAEKAADQVGLSKKDVVVIRILLNNWNDAVNWAEKY